MNCGAFPIHCSGIGRVEVMLVNYISTMERRCYGQIKQMPIKLVNESKIKTKLHNSRESDGEKSEEISSYRREIEEFERHPELNESVFFIMKKLGE